MIYIYIYVYVCVCIVYVFFNVSNVVFGVRHIDRHHIEIISNRISYYMDIL